ncbi:hypothetical protein ONZ43_g2835 [Nemania bipapillata]|uniref:Uncharacterized protein n=1 Tax=Nemania bipapillata TaxID=110536 RepID=A0ACC2IZ33_9PEZI|nr:hypothetical protein ONZ43_g2835 [Nemania bipapillata]
MHLLIFYLSLGLCLGAKIDFISALSPCPAPCQSSGVNSTDWTYYHDLQVFKSCDSPILFETSLYNAIDDPNSHLSLRACTTSPGNLESRALIRAVETLAWGETSSSVDGTSIVSTLVTLQQHMKPPQEVTTSMFISQRDIIAGFYVGPGIDAKSADAVVDAFVHQPGPYQARRAVQWCSPVNGSADRQSFGIVLDLQGNIAAVQSAMASWAAGECLTGGGDGRKPWSASFPSISTTLDSSNTSVSGRGIVTPRDTCHYIQAKSGDGCWALARRCGITEQELESYNGGANFCNNINTKQYICCSPGSLPDFSPQPTHGNCYAYTIHSGDTCAAIAAAHQMQVSGIENNNNLTWGWMGCSDLQIGQKICLSVGKPPFPVSVSNAVCGPQVVDTTPSADPSAWSDLNPCPLNACCDIWGQCGITSEFCTADPAETGAPGTAQPGSNGCISNCGTDIIISASPDSFARVGYFEAWNTDRPCLHMWPQSIPAFYTHVHFAFGNISSDYDVDVSGVEHMFKQFKAKTGFKHILSFGGWAFSTSPETYPIFRQGVTPAQRQTFADNVAKFIMDNGMDGVDFDWEYPGAPDIPGIPAGSPEDGTNYLDFLKRSFSMITKAGVPSHKIMVGMPLYGRSFEMSQAGCYTEMCTFTGPDSGATPGSCTDTAGYISNWEIQQILDNPGNNAQRYFSTTAGDILVYNGTQYISYLTTATYNSWLAWIQSLHFGGTSDWAMDLETSYYGNGSEVGTGSGLVYIDPSVLTDPDATIAYIISIWNYEWTDEAETTIFFTSSVVFPPIIMTENPYSTTGAMWTPDDPEALPPLLGGGGMFGYTAITGRPLPTASPSPSKLINCNFHGSTFPATANTGYPGQSCAYTALPPKTTSISTSKEVVTVDCEVCTYIGVNADCSTIRGCTPTKVTPSSTSKPVTVTVTPTADCILWDQGFFFQFEIYNIAYWATDGGRELKKQESGCGALTGWDWHPANPSYYPYVYFNLPTLIAAGCVERAIASAGGPKISCVDRTFGKRNLEIQDSDGDEGSSGQDSREEVGKRFAVPVAASYLAPSSTPSYSYPASVAATQRYSPMTWSGADADPVVITSTIFTELVTIVTNRVTALPGPTSTTTVG